MDGNTFKGIGTFILVAVIATAVIAGLLGFLIAR